MTIKNIHTIHLGVKLEQGKIRYACIRACYITPEKTTFDKSVVTCKNCLRYIKKEIYQQ